jgi:hypothetical protein
MYTMTALRFSQDGDAALFSLQDMAFNADHCSMAYGKYKCKVGSDRSDGLDTQHVRYVSCSAWWEVDYSWASAEKVV